MASTLQGLCGWEHGLEWQLLRCAVPHLCALASRIMAAYCDIASLGVFGHFIGYLNFLCSVFLY